MLKPIRLQPGKSKPQPSEVRGRDAPAPNRTSTKAVRSKRSRRSLAVEVRPTIVDVFTSEKGSSLPKRVFFVGESLQWNVIHTVTPLLKHVEYRVGVQLELVNNAWLANNKGNFELIWKPQRHLKATFKYQFAATWNSWSIDSIPPFVFTHPALNTSQLTEWLAEGKTLKAAPGFWTITAVVTVRSSVSPTYDLATTSWHYRIFDPEQPDF